MMQTYRKKILLSSLALLLPVPVYLLLGEDVSLCLLPLGMLLGHLLCIFWIFRDPGNQRQSPKVLNLIFWILPIFSNFSAYLQYTLLHDSLPNLLPLLLYLPMGLIFVLIGNYLPKTKPNNTIGIKIPWVYTSPENWAATHRMGGKVWVIGGFLMVLFAFLPTRLAVSGMFLGILLLVAIPSIYSYRFYRREKQAGKPLAPFPISGSRATKASLIVAGLLCLLTVFLLFTGDIHYEFREDSLKIEASYYSDTILYYDVIDSVRYQEGPVSGSRIFGYGSPRLQMGAFQSQELGSYTRYTYGSAQSAVILSTTSGKIYVLSAPTPEETQALYEELLKHR